jgi:hypothetical protein
MGAGAAGGAPSFSLPILIAVSLLMAVPLYLAARRLKGDAARFLIGAIWLRYIMSVFHEITFRPLLAGLSLNAVGSILVTAAGLFLLQRRRLLLKPLLPVYALILLALFSAHLNAGLFTALNAVVKYLYFCVFFIATYEALRANPADRLFRLLLVAFAPLLVFQLLSIATGVVKASELDGSRSYIGGYDHEAAFSVALATFFVAAAFADGLGRWLKGALLAVLLAGILLANYRTTILAVLPFAAWLLVSRGTRRFVPTQRPAVLVGCALAALLLVFVAADVDGDRFADLGRFLADPSAYIKPQREFTLDERHLLSGRAYIWSGYIFAWIDGTPARHLFGFGPDSWSDWFRVYPHNTLIAYLFELGLAGLAALIWWWSAMLALAARARRGLRADLLFAMGSFILLNLATMALWQVEGLILFALVCGYAMFSAMDARRARPKPGVERGKRRIGGGEIVVQGPLAPS